MTKPLFSPLFCLSLVVALTTSPLTAQREGPWEGWTDSAGGDAKPFVVADGLARLDLSAGRQRVLSHLGRFADGRIELHWRASDGIELSLALRGEDGQEGTRIRLASARPAGAIVGPREERADLAGRRWHRAEIVARGASIQVRIDGGEPAAEALEPRFLDGTLSLRMARVPGPDEASPRETRRIELREPVIRRSGSHGWKPVLLGTQPIDDELWERIPGGSWQIENDAVVGSCTKSEQRHGILLSRFEVDDFSARIVYRAVRGQQRVLLPLRTDRGRARGPRLPG